MRARSGGREKGGESKRISWEPSLSHNAGRAARKCKHKTLTFLERTVCAALAAAAAYAHGDWWSSRCDTAAGRASGRARTAAATRPARNATIAAARSRLRVLGCVCAVACARSRGKHARAPVHARTRVREWQASIRT
eukprot:6201896-Pleurochrysis_carterae.AAC.2